LSLVDASFLGAERDREREADLGVLDFGRSFLRSVSPFFSLLVRRERLRSRGDGLRRR
jgi:hypothetical protein